MYMAYRQAGQKGSKSCCYNCPQHKDKANVYITKVISKQESLALASMARDDLPARSTASSTAAAMHGKVGSEFET